MCRGGETRDVAWEPRGAAASKSLGTTGLNYVENCSVCHKNNKKNIWRTGCMIGIITLLLYW